MDSVAVGDQDLLHALGVRHRGLRNPRIVGPGDLVREAQERHFALHRHDSGVDRDRMWSRNVVWHEPGALVEARFVGHAARRTTGDGHDVVRVGHVAVRVHGLLAMDHAYPGALIDTGDRVFDALVVEHELQRLVTFPEQLGPIATAR